MTELRRNNILQYIENDITMQTSITLLMKSLLSRSMESLSSTQQTLGNTHCMQKRWRETS